MYSDVGGRCLNSYAQSLLQGWRFLSQCPVDCQQLIGFLCYLKLNVRLPWMELTHATDSIVMHRNALPAFLSSSIIRTFIHPPSRLPAYPDIFLTRKYMLSTYSVPNLMLSPRSDALPCLSLQDLESRPIASPGLGKRVTGHPAVEAMCFTWSRSPWQPSTIHQVRVKLSFSVKSSRVKIILRRRNAAVCSLMCFSSVQKRTAMNGTKDRHVHNSTGGGF